MDGSGWHFLVKQIVPFSPVVAVSSGGLLLTSIRYDEPFLGDVQRGYNGAWATYLDITNNFGGPEITFPVLALFGGSFTDKKTHDSKMPPLLR